MASTFTTSKLLEKQGTGDNSGTWGVVLNSVLDDIDTVANGYLAKSIAGSSDTTLTDDELLNRVLKLTGTLTGNVNVIVPARESIYKVWNGADGAFTTTFKPSGGTGLVLPQGSVVDLFTDGTTMFQVDGVTTRGLTDQATTAGSANAQTLTLTPAIAALTRGQRVRGIIGAGLTNTAAATLTVSGLAATAVRLPSTLALRGGEMREGSICDWVFDGTYWVLVSVYMDQDAWTPTLAVSGGSISSYTTQVGQYTIIGNMVFFAANVVVASVSSPSGTLDLNLPFTAANVTNLVWSVNMNFISISIGGGVSIQGRISPNGSTCRINAVTAAGAEGALGGNVAANTNLIVSGFYQRV